MGISVSATFTIIVVACMVALGLAYPTLANTGETFGGAIQDTLTADRHELDTAINITSATHNTTTDILLIDVDNTGSTTLSVSDTDVLVDGNYTNEFNEQSVNGSTDSDLWAPGQTLHLNLTEASVTRVKVVTEGGIAEARTV